MHDLICGRSRDHPSRGPLCVLHWLQTGQGQLVHKLQRPSQHQRLRAALVQAHPSPVTAGVGSPVSSWASNLGTAPALCIIWLVHAEVLCAAAPQARSQRTEEVLVKGVSEAGWAHPRPGCPWPGGQVACSGYKSHQPLAMGCKHAVNSMDACAADSNVAATRITVTCSCGAHWRLRSLQQA